MSALNLNRITDVISTVNRGRFSEECDRELARAMDALRELPDQKGSAVLTLTLTVALDNGRVDVRPDVKMKPPKKKGFTATPFWLTDNGLSVQHPSQDDMFAGPRAVRERDFG